MTDKNFIDHEAELLFVPFIDVKRKAAELKYMQSEKHTWNPVL
jgi:hypothetical protein